MSSSPSVFVTGDAPIDAAVQRVLRWRFGARVADLAAVLDAGGIVAVPTESSYGLAVDPRRGDAVDAVFRIKGRDAGKALPVVIDASARLAALGIDPDQPAVRWAARHWPAALSVVLPLCLDAPPVPAALPPSPAMGEPAATLAVRVPAHDRLRALLAALARPLTATSANPAGAPSLRDPLAVARLLATLDGVPTAVVDDGVLPGGPPSTLVRWPSGAHADAAPIVLRAGRVALLETPAEVTA